MAARPFLGPALWCAGAYLFGSLPTGLIVSRRRGVDIRAVGSGNIGATNVARALGRRWAIVVLIVDASKGFIPVFVAGRVGLHGGAASVASVGLSAIVGHMFTIFLRGQGGKGVATSLGVAFALSPPLALVCVGTYAITYGLTRVSSLGSMMGVWAFPCLALAQGALPPPHVRLSLVTALLVTWRHRGNLARLLRGEER